MSYWKRLKAEAARHFFARLLENVVVPGHDPIPQAGAKLIDKGGHPWEVKGYGIRHEGNHATRWWEWDSSTARRIGPLIDLTPRPNVIAYPGPGVAPRYNVPRYFLDQAAGRAVGRQENARHE